MTPLVAVIAVLVLFASILAVAEAALSRLTRVRAMALREDGHRNAALLEEIERDPAHYLNPIYLTVLAVQNGAAILVAVVSEARFGDLGLTVISVAFTVGYFVVVEAMARTFGILHSDRAALALAPLVWFLGRMLALPTRALIGIANVLLPGPGLAQGPFVSEREEIRSMAEVGHAEGSIAETERRMIHSIFEFGDTTVRQILVPRPDVVAVEESSTLRAALDVVINSGFSRVPVYRRDLDKIEGVLYAKDALKALHQGPDDVPLRQLVRPTHFVPETKKASDLLREMRHEQFHMAIVVNEYGSVAGLVTLEDLLEELVGDIADEHDVKERDIEAIGDGGYRVDASLPIHELNDLIGTDLPHDRWNTVGGLMFGLLGTIPTEGQSVSLQGFRFLADKVQGRRVTTVVVRREPEQAGTA